MDEEGRLPVPENLLIDITTQLQSHVSLWKSRVQHLHSEMGNDQSPLLPSLVFTPIIDYQTINPKKEEFKICSVCNTKLAANALFCPECGAKFI